MKARIGTGQSAVFPRRPGLAAVTGEALPDAVIRAHEHDQRAVPPFPYHGFVEMTAGGLRTAQTGEGLAAVLGTHGERARAAPEGRRDLGRTDAVAPDRHRQKPFAVFCHSRAVHHHFAADTALLRPEKNIRVRIFADTAPDGVDRHDAPEPPESAQRVDPDNGIVTATLRAAVGAGNGVFPGLAVVVALEQDDEVAVGFDEVAAVKHAEHPALCGAFDAGDALPKTVRGGKARECGFISDQHDRSPCK